MSKAEDLLAADKAEAISRMNPFELAERDVMLRMMLGHNALDLEPINVEGGTLFTVTSGLVADRALTTDTAVEGEDLVRKQVAFGALTAFADVVGFYPKTETDDATAHLYRVELPILPDLAETRAPFRSSLVQILHTGDPHLPAIRTDQAQYSQLYYHEVPGNPDDDESKFASKGEFEILATEQSEVDVEIVGVDSIDKEHGVRTHLSGPVTAELESFSFATISNNGVQAGPTSKRTVAFTIPEAMGRIRPRRAPMATRVPDDAEIVPDEKGKLVLRGGRGGNSKYQYADLQPHIDGETAFKFIPREELGLVDATDIFLRSLGAQIAKQMPLNASVSYEWTVEKAKEQIRMRLLANRTPVMFGVGCLAVATRMAELPATMPGIMVDRQFFLKAS